MIQFTIKDWHIWAKDGQNIAPATLPDFMREWLEDSGIREYGVEWLRLVDPTSKSYHRPQDVLETVVVFMKDKEALLFKLRWYEFIANPS